MQQFLIVSSGRCVKIQQILEWYDSLMRPIPREARRLRRRNILLHEASRQPPLQSADLLVLLARVRERDMDIEPVQYTSFFGNSLSTGSSRFAENDSSGSQNFNRYWGKAWQQQIWTNHKLLRCRGENQSVSDYRVPLTLPMILNTSRCTGTKMSVAFHLEL